MIPQHLLESSFVPMSGTPGDPGEISRLKAFYGERNKAAQDATQWYDRMQLEKETLEKNSDLAWAKFNWEKEWEPKKFYAGLDLQRDQLNWEEDYQQSLMDLQQSQNDIAMSYLDNYASGLGSREDNSFSPYGNDPAYPTTVYGEGYQQTGSEEFDWYSEKYAPQGLYRNDYYDYEPFSASDWYGSQSDYDITYGWD